YSLGRLQSWGLLPSVRHLASRRPSLDLRMWRPLQDGPRRSNCGGYRIPAGSTRMKPSRAWLRSGGPCGMLRRKNRKNQGLKKTAGPDTHHSHLEEVVPTIRNLHWGILENSCKFPLRNVMQCVADESPDRNLEYSIGAFTITHTLRCF